MALNYTSLLSLAQPVTGTESGNWGGDVNNAITAYLDIAIAGTLSLTSANFTAGAITLANTQGVYNATNISTTSAQYAVIKVSSLATNSTITAPSSSKTYLVINADSTYTVTIKASGQTGYTVGTNSRAWVVFNGTDYVLASTNDITKLAGTLPVASGGTGVTTLTGIAKGNGTSAFTAAIANTDYLTPPSGTALLKANSGGALANAVANTDYLTPPSGTALLKANSGGALANAVANTDYLTPPSGTALLKANSGGALSNAVANTDYVALTGAATISGKTFTTPIISGTPATTGGTIGYDATATVPTWFNGAAVQQVGYLNVPQNSQSTNYTLVITDAGKHIYHPGSDTSARTFTIPANSSVAFPIGTAVTFVNGNGAGTITISITTDTLILAGSGSSGSRTLAPNGLATAIKVASTQWLISGTGLI